MPPRDKAASGSAYHEVWRALPAAYLVRPVASDAYVGSGRKVGNVVVRMSDVPDVPGHHT